MDTKIKEIIETKKRIVICLRQLLQGEREIRRKIGGIARTCVYELENESYRFLPRLLAKDYRIKLRERLRRGYLPGADGRDIEVNILGEGELDGKSVVIIGECKSKLSKNDVDNFIRRKLERLKEAIGAEIFPVLVTHMISQGDVEEYVRRKGLPLYYSYDFVEMS